jgi:predicted dehydrogenase
MIKIGMMSFAHMHAYSYAAAVSQIPGAKISAVWDDDSKRGKSAADQCDAKFYKSRDKFLASKIDAVVICSENVHHRAMVEAAAKAGKWVLCEKPLATTVADAKSMIKVCKKAGVGLGTAFPCRYVPASIELKNRLDAGELGDLYAAATTNNGSNPGDWFVVPKLAGGGATMDHTVHVVDMLRWLTGKEVTSVYCELDRLVNTDIKTDDVGVVHMELEGGTKVSHVASWNRKKSFPTWGDVTMELIGEKGVLNLDAFNQKLDVYSDKAMTTEWAYWGDNCDLGLMQDFVAAVADRREPSVTGEDGLRAVEVTVAAYKSAKSGKVVKL